MKCDRARDLFSDYLEGSIDYALTATVRSHLDECSECRQRLQGFQQTWGMLDALPEMEVPHSLRHDIVMRVVRAEHEKATRAKHGTFGLTWATMFGRLVPARAVAIACAGAVLALILLQLPLTFVKEGSVGPIDSVVTTRDRESGAIDAAPWDSQERMKAEWIGRKLQRNTVLVTAKPVPLGDDRCAYQIVMSINRNAWPEAVVRIGAQVYLLPDRRDGQVLLDEESLAEAQRIWPDPAASETAYGDILADQPVMLQWIVDYSQGRSGAAKLLVTWKFRGREFGQIVYLPTTRPDTTAPSSLDFTTGGFKSAPTGLYSALQSIAQKYGKTIITNARIDRSTVTVDLGSPALEEALRTTLLPIGLTWKAFDNAIYVDKATLGTTASDE